jgi:alpha-beta hydrolase superfamily lysophospholipase
MQSTLSPTSDSTLSTFVASDGENVVIQDWALEPGVALRGVVILVHGLGEHAGRYEHVAESLTATGFAVRGYDQVGHGESGGLPGALPSDTRLLDDLADIVDASRARMPKGLPLILLGHSMGGVVAARFVAQKIRPMQGLILSSPAFKLGLSPLQKFLSGELPTFAQGLRMGSGVRPDFLSHDPKVVAAYKADPLVHDRISVRLARFIHMSGPQTISLASHWHVPTLLIYAGQDHVVNPDGSRAFAARAPKNMVQTVCFEQMYHEIFNELDAAPVFGAMHAWLDHRF